MIEFAIIAAGEGSRLRQEGLSVSKPMLLLNGIPMIERLVGIFVGRGASCVHVLINSRSPDLADFLSAKDFGIPIHVSVKDTLSSLHSLHALTTINPAWESCILTTTDTVFSESDFADYLKGFALSPDVDAYMGITTFIEDESPLFVDVDEENNVRGFYDRNEIGTPYVSGGIYGLKRRALDNVAMSVASGNSRMRNYQRSLIAQGFHVKAHLFGKIVDVDHLQDIAVAEAFLKTTEQK